MHEILEDLPGNARVLDLGSKSGSFPRGTYSFQTIRLDLAPNPGNDRPFVRADAARLPFRSRSFDAVILNHCLEHITNLKPALQEVGRVIKENGRIFVAVPDATTISDRLYRKVYRDSGGHVNLFASSAELAATLSWYFGLPLAAARELLTSFSFLHAANTPDGVSRRQMRVPPLPEFVLALATAATRVADRWLGTRTRIYGWALYFGCLGQKVDPHPMTNVCVRCGAAHPREALTNRSRRWMLFPCYTCPGCMATNLLT